MGGGVMRTAAKVAGFAVASSGISGVPASSAVRRAATLRTATSTADEVKLVTSSSEGGVQRQYSAVDDWVFACGDDDVAVGAPRVVFGGVPSLQEAKEATSELKAALETTYLSSSAESEGSVADNGSILHLSNSQMVEGNAFVGSEVAVSSSAIMAFRFLKESPVAQSVVASIACDPNVWNAVLQNEELQGFLQSQQTCLAVMDKNLTAKLIADSNILNHPSMTAFSNLSEDGESKPGGGFKDGESKPGGRFMDILDKIKSAVVDMMTGLSDFFVNLFGGKAAKSDGNTGFSANTLMEGSLIGLAVMAIVVILLKRA